MRTRGTVPLGLGHFAHVQQHGNVLFAGHFFGLLKGGDELGIVPAAGDDDFVALLFYLALGRSLALKSGEDF